MKKEVDAVGFTMPVTGPPPVKSWFDRSMGRVMNSSHSTRWGKIVDTVDALSDVAIAVLSARGKFRPIDYAAIGMKSISAGMAIHRIWTTEVIRDLSEPFTKPGSEWQMLPSFLCSIAFKAEDFRGEPIASFTVVREGKVVAGAWRKSIDGIELGWVGDANNDRTPDRIWSPTPRKIHEVVSRRLWERAGSMHVVKINGTEVVPYDPPTALRETDFLRAIEMRVRLFLERGVSRSILLNGEPGTGKTTAAYFLAERLGYRTIIISADDLCFSMHSPDGPVTAGARMAEVMRPEILVVNDIDRLPKTHQLALLEILDEAKAYAKLIFVTTNHYRDLVEPLRRPGRIDDIIQAPGLTRPEILDIAPNALQIADRMVGWPIAYVLDMRDRLFVLGSAALSELAEVEQRLLEVREDGQYS